MSTRPDLSIIIPSYNCADLVGRAVESAYAFSERSTEVIVVDDGSTDDTAQVLAGLIQRFPELRVLRKANGGLSSARNHGMDHASGRYVLFLDADDELIPVSVLDELATSPEVLRIGVEEISISGGRRTHIEPAEAATGIEYLAISFGRRDFFTPSCAYIYQKDWLAGTGIRFVDGLLHEDILFTVEALLVCHCFAVSKQLVYRYIRRDGSITYSVDEQKLRRRIQSLGFIIHRLTWHSNHHPGADIDWWTLNTIDFATTLSKQSSMRLNKYLVMVMEIRHFLTYRLWGRYRNRRDVRYRLRQRLEDWLSNSQFHTGI